MPNHERVSLNLDDENQIDLEELTGAAQRPAPTAEQQKAIFKAGEEQGFISREPTKRRRVSPYTAQFGGKCREGMKPLFQEIAAELGLYDTQTLEAAILALIKQEGLTNLLAKYEWLTK